MYQAKGTAPIFNVDRIACSFSPSYTIEVILELASEAQVPTPPLTFTAYLSLGSQLTLLEGLLIDTFFPLDVFSDIKLWRKVSSKGAGFAFKGTNILWRNDKRWLPLLSSVSYIFDVILELTNEVKIPNPSFIFTLPLSLSPIYASTSFQALVSNISLFFNISSDIRLQRKVSSKGAGFAFKGTNALYRADKLWLAAIAPTTLLAEISLDLISESELEFPGVATYSSPLALLPDAEEKITLVETLNLLLVSLSHYALSLFFGDYIKFLETCEFTRALSASLFLKNKIAVSLLDILALSAPLSLIAVYLPPTLHSLFAESFLSLKPEAASLYYIPFNAPLLIKSFVKTELLAPNTYEALLSFSPFWASEIKSAFISNIAFIASTASLLSIRALTNLALKLLMRSSSLKEIIGTILVELQPKPQFAFSSDFTTELLLYLTSSLPLPSIILPKGCLVFSDIVRIYKYLIDLQ